MISTILKPGRVLNPRRPRNLKRALGAAWPQKTLACGPSSQTSLAVFLAGSSCAAMHTAVVRTEVSSKYAGGEIKYNMRLSSSRTNAGYSPSQDFQLPMLQAEPNGKGIELRRVQLDLHADGEADGLPGSTLNIVMPRDWRDLPRVREDPPFWASIWPSGSALAAYILQHPEIVAGKTVCDLGCGIGTAGISAALAGGTHVVLADRNEHALRCAELGVQCNSMPTSSTSNIQSAPALTTHLDWHDESSVRRLEAKGPFDVLLACDVLAEAGVVGMSVDSSTRPFASLAKRLLHPSG